jgi:hypothetical protein
VAVPASPPLPARLLQVGWDRASLPRLRPGIVAAVLVLVLIAGHLALHRNEGGWQAKGHIRDTLTMEGHLVEWEWFHVGETIVLLDAQGNPPAQIASQNLYRLAGAYLTALLRKPLGSVYWGSVASTVVFWLIAAWALYGLTRLMTGSSDAAVVAAVLAGTAPGFIGYLGNVDPHPAGYAAVAVWLLLVERWQLLDTKSDLAQTWPQPIFAGLLLCLAGYTIEVAYPLLLFAWLYYGLRGAREAAGVNRILGKLAVLTVAFVLPYTGFRLLANYALFEEVVALNDPVSALRGNGPLILEQGIVGWVVAKWVDLPERWLAAFPAGLSLLALLGAATISRRWLLWAVCFTASFVTAILLAKPATRTLFLVYPAMYVLAAGGMLYLSSWLSRQTAMAHAPAFRLWLGRLLLALMVALVVVTTNADLWGDYRIPIRWYGTQ